MALGSAEAGWQQVGERCFVRTNPGWKMNSGLVVGDERALVVDTGAGPEQAADLLAAVRTVTDKPLVVANTHAHFDHYFGNAYFFDHGVRDFWAHLAAAEAMAANGERDRSRLVSVEPAMAAGHGDHTGIYLPNRLVRDSPVDLDLGGMVATLFHLGRAHTAGDLLVGAGNVLFAGDTVEEGGHPNFEDSFPHDWQKVLGKIIAIDELYTSIVPGHGRVVDPDFVRTQFHKLRQAIKTSSTAIHESSSDYTKAVPVLPYGPVESRNLIIRMKTTGSGTVGSVLR